MMNDGNVFDDLERMAIYNAIQRGNRQREQSTQEGPPCPHCGGPIPKIGVKTCMHCRGNLSWVGETPCEPGTEARTREVLALSQEIADKKAKEGSLLVFIWLIFHVGTQGNRMS